MIDPRTTNIVGQRVLIMRRSTDPAERQKLGRGIVRVIDYQGSCFAFLIEAVGAINHLGVGNGGLFEVTTWSEETEVVVDREVVLPAPTGGREELAESLHVRVAQLEAALNEALTIAEWEMSEYQGKREHQTRVPQLREVLAGKASIPSVIE